MAGYVPIIEQCQRANAVRPQTTSDDQYLKPLQDESGEDGAEKVDPDQKEEETWKETRTRIEDFETRVAEQFEDNNKGTYDSIPILKAPAKPIQEELDRHQATHTPFAAWCPHCQAARNARCNHPKRGRRGRIVLDTETCEGPTTVSMDYMYLHDRVGTSQEIQHNPPYLVVVGHTLGRCWAHRVPNKGVNGDAHWVLKKILQELENTGLSQTRILLKSDQEPSIICVQKAMQELKSDIVPINSPVGEFTVKRVQEKMRTLRNHIEKGIQQQFPEDSAIIAWMARWAAELLSKYAPGDDGRTP